MEFEDASIWGTLTYSWGYCAVHGVIRGDGHMAILRDIEGLEIRQRDARDTDPSKVYLGWTHGIFEGHRGTREGNLQCVPRGRGTLRIVEGH